MFVVSQRYYVLGLNMQRVEHFRRMYGLSKKQVYPITQEVHVRGLQPLKDGVVIELTGFGAHKHAYEIYASLRLAGVELEDVHYVET